MPIQPILLLGSKGFKIGQDEELKLHKMTKLFCEFVLKTKNSLDIAAYHFKFSGHFGEVILEALTKVASRAQVRIAYFDENKLKSQIFYGNDTSSRSIFQKDKFSNVLLKRITPIDLHDLPDGIVEAPIEGGGALMHNKYMIRDQDAVWMGTANFTTDGWGLQDNNVLIFTEAPELANYYTTDFDDLWKYGRVAGTGEKDNGVFEQDGHVLEVDFSPGDGQAIDRNIAEMIANAKISLDIASMVISSGRVLKALSDAIDNDILLNGVYDQHQMFSVERIWEHSGASEKAKFWEKVKPKLVPKMSRRYEVSDPEGFYNFMHNKTLVVDKEKIHTGSFNFSGNATRNAENVIRIQDPLLAKDFSKYIFQLVSLYKE